MFPENEPQDDLDLDLVPEPEADLDLDLQGMLQDDDDAPPDEPAPDPQAQQPQQPPKLVPVSELVQERRQRQELQRRLEALEQQQRAQQPPPPEPKTPEQEAGDEPDYLDDPKGWAEWNRRVTELKVARVEKQAQEAIALARGTNEEAQVTQAIQAREAQFVSRTPDYFNALNHVRQVAAQQLLLQYPQATQEQVAQVIMQQERQLSRQLLMQGRDPAEFAYQYAKTLGYRGPAADGEGDQAAPAAPTPLMPQAGGLPQQQGRAAIRGLQPGAPLREAQASSNMLPEFDAAMAERFGRRR